MFTLGEIDRELETTAPLFALAEHGELDPIYTMAAAAVLHSVYSALESIFSMIQKRIDGRLPDTSQWHRVILENMSRSTERRSAVLSPESRDLLADYLAFRHRFRHGYGWSLDSTKVATKLRQLPPVLDRVRNEILAFLTSIDGVHSENE
jgi:uncharacterized protein YutE (UPF0331/DUF86 family)